MNKLKFLPSVLLLTALAAASCAVEPNEDITLSYDRVMTAWINVNHPGMTPYGTYGAYVLDKQTGDGPAVTDSAYVWVHYTKKALDQSILSGNLQSVDEQLGLYAASNYYGSDIWRVDQGYLPEGLEEVLKTLRSGGSASIALPYSSSYHDYSVYTAFSGTSESDNYLFDLTVDTVMTDIYAYQEQVMRDWFQTHYDTADTLSEGLYFKLLTEKTDDGQDDDAAEDGKENESATDTISDGAAVQVRYIGRLLNGQVFDTNIEDTAKFYRLWKNGATYNALSIEYYKDDSQFAEHNSVVTGFGKAIRQMNYGDEAVTLFESRLGYGESGSGKSIPEYAPLIFWLYIEPKN